MKLPTNAFVSAMEKLERERRMMVAALGPTYEVRRFIEEATRGQRTVQEALERTKPFAKLVEDARRMQRFAELAAGPAKQFAQMAEANRTQRAIRSALADSSAFAEFARTIDLQRRNLDQALRLARGQELAASVAISRSLMLSPQLSTVTAAIIDRLEEELSVDTPLANSEAWIPCLEDLLGALENSIETAEEKIDRRALLRFLERVLLVILAIYGIIYAHISSDQMNARLGGVGLSIEENRSQFSQEHDKFKKAQEESMGRLESRLDALSERLKEHVQDGEAPAFYIVQRRVPLTEERRYQGTRITWLLPGQEVEVVEHSRKWLRVIAYDMETGKTHVGWVLKKYLRRVGYEPRPRKT